MLEPGWYVYVARCGDDSLYTGIAKDVERRLREHNQAKGARYTRGRGPVQLEGVRGPMPHVEALRLERLIKRTPKTSKLERLAIAVHDEAAKSETCVERKNAKRNRTTRQSPKESRSQDEREEEEKETRKRGQKRAGDEKSKQREEQQKEKEKEKERRKKKGQQTKKKGGTTRAKTHRGETTKEEERPRGARAPQASDGPASQAISSGR